jgi:hypothetical protein
MFVPLILLAFLFRKTRKFRTKYEKLKNIIHSLTGQEIKNVKAKNESKRRLSFPWWFKIVLYFVSILGMIGSTFFTILKG